MSPADMDHNEAKIDHWAARVVSTGGQCIIKLPMHLISTDIHGAIHNGPVTELC